jgi:hypothetical protein
VLAIDWMLEVRPQSSVAPHAAGVALTVVVVVVVRCNRR